MRLMRNHSNCKTMMDKPNIANKIKTVSHMAAVIVAGNARANFGCVAPCEKMKTFCTPKGKINPNAKINPCRIGSILSTLFQFQSYYDTTKRKTTNWMVFYPSNLRGDNFEMETK